MGIWLGDGVGWADWLADVVGLGVGVGVTVVLAHAATTTAVSRTSPTRAVVRLIATDPTTRGPNAIGDIPRSPFPKSRLTSEALSLGRRTSIASCAR